MPLAILALTLALLGAPVMAETQTAKKVYRLGVLSSSSASTESNRVNALRQGLRDLGYIEGQNVVTESRYADGKMDRLPDLAAELVGLKVDAIVTAGARMIRAAMRATKTIPIVMAFTDDPVAQGFVASLARPGGNITGLSNLSRELSGKRLELLKEAFPKVSRVAVLWERDAPGPIAALKEMQAVAQALGLQLQAIEVRSADDFESAFEAATRHQAGALIVLQSPLPVIHKRRIVDLAARNRLPGMYTQEEFVEVGGLMSYAPNYADLYRRAATYVDKILKGAKPADLPVEQPTKFEFIINLKTAKALVVRIPPSVLLRADRVIE